MLFLTPNQQCQSTEENLNHRLRPGKTSHWATFFLGPPTLEGIDAAVFTPAF